MTANTVTYPSKQGANGQTVTSEFYSLDITVALTDDFLEQTEPISGSFIYSYYFTTFVVPADFCEGDNIRSMSEHAIYTCVTTDHYWYNDGCTLDTTQLPADSSTSTGHNVPIADQWFCHEE